jgi:glycosyltransferase involved in cell wall biosynthesis
MKPSLTIIILTFNEERNVPELIGQLEDFSYPIFVVDSYSTDATLDYLIDNKITYVQHEFINYSKQRNWAQANNPFKTDWVLHLDADERLTPELILWLNETFPIVSNQFEGFMFGRRAIFMDRWIKSHYNYHLRLYKTAYGKCEEKAYDQHYILNGRSCLVKKADMTSKVCDNLNEFVAGHNKWAFLEAIDIVNKRSSGEVKNKFTGSPIETTRWLKNNVFQKTPLFLRSFAYFIYRYLFKLGFLEGKEGLIFHILQAFWFRFLVDAKVYELKKGMSTKQCSLAELLRTEYNYTLPIQ